MHPFPLVEVTVVALAVFCALTGRWRQLMQDLQEALNHWRGGPPPTHPMPADDGVILLRRRRKG